MNIFHLIPEMTLGDGLSNAVFTTAQSMAMLNHNVYLSSEIIDDFYKERLERFNIKWIYSPNSQKRKNPVSFLKNQVIIKKYIKEFKIDILHTHNRWNAFYAHSAVKANTCHIFSDHNILSGYKFWGIHAHAVITDSELNKSHLTDYLKVPENKISIHPAAFIEFDKYQSLLNIENLNLTDSMIKIERTQNTINIGQIARLADQKGQFFLLEVLPEIIQQNPNIKMYIIGDGPLKSQIQKKIIDKKLENHLILLPVTDDVVPFIKQMDFMLYSSKHEGFCVAVSESLLASKPVIGTKVGGIPDQIIDGENGFLYDFGDAELLKKRCLELANDQKLLNKMASAARGIYQEKFSFEKTSKHLEKTYINILNKYKSDRSN